MPDFLSPRTRATLDAADAAHAAGDRDATHQLIRDAYTNGTATDQAILNGAAAEVIAKNDRR